MYLTLPTLSLGLPTSTTPKWTSRGLLPSTSSSSPSSISKIRTRLCLRGLVPEPMVFSFSGPVEVTLVRLSPRLHKALHSPPSPPPSLGR